MNLTVDERWIASKQTQSRKGEVHEDDVLQELLDHKQAGTYPGRVFSFSPMSPWELTAKDGGRVGQDVVSLNRFEYLVCHYFGPRRTKAARNAGMVNMIQSAVGGSKDEAFVEANGLCGEIAYGVRQNLYPQDQIIIQARTTNQDFGDYLEIVDGRDIVVDVKTSVYPAHG